MRLTPKQAAFAREYVKDSCGTAAAKRAGYSERTANEQAAQMLARAHIAAEVKRLQDELAAAARVTVESLLRETEEARGVALAGKQASAMVAAITLKARLTGLLIEKTEDTVKREQIEYERAQRGEVKKAADMLRTAATSLGLPAEATPAQIVGELAKRPVATPEAFALLHTMGNG